MNEITETKGIELGSRAIENGFPFEDISLIAELESYRKELNRPIYYLQKWWARRLGSIFRSLIIASVKDKSNNILNSFYTKNDFKGITVYDPFMGSGTTVGEAYKLGCTAIGKDINPVVYQGVKVSLGKLDFQKVEDFYKKLKNNAGNKIQKLYKGKDSEGRECDVLYYFWVKVVNCPSCKKEVDLFSSYVFAKHAYAKKNTKVQVYCPNCTSIFGSHYQHDFIECPDCGYGFDQNKGPAKRVNATCNHCDHNFAIAEKFENPTDPNSHKLFAKLVLNKKGDKEYLPVNDDDITRYNNVSNLLKNYDFEFPKIPLKKGHNTNQALNYDYRYWHEFFNDRQLYGLTILAEEIEKLPECNEKNAFISLFLGVLEFNNMFASYKGEGTGAVRHMFSHHTLKPERIPLEANIWGTPKSSGSFSGLYKLRLLRLINYRNDPFEIRPNNSGKKTSKMRGINKKINANIKPITKDIDFRKENIYLGCGDSSKTELPDKSIDFVITDPPFFDNVHYSELADFFFAWQQTFFTKNDRILSTRNKHEVQDVDENKFSLKLQSVFQECNRVLKDSGLLVFSYHHSKESGWTSLGKAIKGAGFSIVQAHPIKSEMSLSTTKKSNPIDIDVILICSKNEFDKRPKQNREQIIEIAKKVTANKVERFNDKGRKLSHNDIKVILYSHFLIGLSSNRKKDTFVKNLNEILSDNDDIISQLFDDQRIVQKDNVSQKQFLEVV